MMEGFNGMRDRLEAQSNNFWTIIYENCVCVYVFSFPAWIHHETLKLGRILGTICEAEKAGAATTFCIDGRETAEKNPTRYINAARSKEPLASGIQSSSAETYLGIE